MPSDSFIHARQALLPGGWTGDVLVTVSPEGRIGAVETGRGPTPGAHRVDTLLPAPVNAHSHAFQRAMAGLTEARGPTGTDSFWTWRALMYRFLDRLTPEHVEAIAALVQMEMLEAGYAASVEFHYLHHQPGGAPYADPAEMSARIAAAAATSGIGLTLLPVFYQYGGCDGRALEPGQLRFGTTPDQFALLHGAAAKALKGLPDDTILGAAPHSLRAVAPDALSDIAALAPKGPLHMHLAEQVAEVKEVSAHLGQRPVEWVLDHAAPDKCWTFIHCTQMEPHETEALAQSGAVAGLCPITEANLGDGIFDGTGWMEAGGAIAIGSDSNIRISLTGELRTLEYSQRLRDRSRAALASPGQSTGRRLFDAVLAGGARAAGRDSGRIAAGAWADLLALDTSGPTLYGRSGDTLLDTFVFAGDDRVVSDVWSAGRHMVRAGAHRFRDAITARYARVIDDLAEVL